MSGPVVATRLTVGAALAAALLAGGTAGCEGSRPGGGGAADTPAARPAAATAAPTAAGAPWVVVVENPSIRMSIDTSRVAAAEGHPRLWLGFDLAEAWPAVEELKAPYRHYESHQELDCAAGRARGLAMRIVDTTGAAYARPAPDSAWTTFAEHPLSEPALRSVCAKLAELGGPRGR
ncbi:MAG TPA: surface-adhesin E family protein [Gemmatimonadaceae bacterium]|nr:surface-adhesin E family protein [Gemmatimonadaceae bacterium]